MDRMASVTLNHIKLSCDLQNTIAEYQDCKEAFDNGVCDKETLSMAIQNLRERFGMWADTGTALNDYCNAVLFNR